MPQLGIALPAACLRTEQDLSKALQLLQRSAVRLIQVHLITLLTAPASRLMLQSLQRTDLKLVVHLETAEDVFSIPPSLKMCTAWTHAILHLPSAGGDLDGLRWCADRLAARRVRLLIENDDEPEAAKHYSPAARRLADIGLCFDAGHDALADSGVIQDDVLCARIEMIHLHGVDLRNRIAHLDPWIRGVVTDPVLMRIAQTRPLAPVVLEVRDLDLTTLPQRLEFIRSRLTALGWAPEHR